MVFPVLPSGFHIFHKLAVFSLTAAADDNEATAVYMAGRTAYEAGDYRDAAEKFGIHTILFRGMEEAKERLRELGVD